MIREGIRTQGLVPQSNSAPPVAVYRPTKSVLSSNVICTTSFAVDGTGGSPQNRRFSLAITNFCRVPISETRPISKGCQHVTSLIDLNISARSSERDQRILASSRSAKRALLHRERREVFESRVNICCSRTLSESDSQYILTQSFCDLHVRLLSEVTRLFEYVV